jgi:voltage-gated potassium channel
MDFVRQAGTSAALVALTLLIQCVGMAALIHWARFRFARGMYRLGPVRSAILMVRLTSVIIVLHLLQILLWAGFYRWSCIPSWQSAFYFSTASYSTVGSGDLLLPVMWRTLGAMESITGVLMCGVSASFLFAFVIRLVQREERFAPELARPQRRSTPVHPNANEWTENETKR